MRGATYGVLGQLRGCAISIHAPLAGCDPFPIRSVLRILYFNPRTPCGVRHFIRREDALWRRFQSTHPLRGATTLWVLPETAIVYFNPRTPCGVRLHPAAGDDGRAFISIHAPLAGCDCTANIADARPSYFNPRTPCGVRPSLALTLAVRMAFQSTHPLRGATDTEISPYLPAGFQSTHPLRGATVSAPAARGSGPISIHAPLAGCDFPSSGMSRGNMDFNPRTPCGVRLAGSIFILISGCISIHAPLAGCD